MEIPTHPIKNINLAAFLKASGIPVVRVDVSNSRELVWHFAQPDRCRELVGQFYQGVARTDPQAVLLEAKRLKDTIFEARRNGGRINDKYEGY